MVPTGTKVTDAGLKHVAQLPGLKSLTLGESAISEAGLAHLSALSSLQTLYLSALPVSDEGIKALQKAVPGLRIVRYPPN
jgi:hypothetical protein